MRKCLPKAKFIAFTETPITKEEKSTLGEFYGGEYIDVYAIKESVADGNTLEILYNQALPELFLDKPGLDSDFEETYEHEDKERKALLRRTVSKKYKSSFERMWVIAEHIVKHYVGGAKQEGHKAMLVCTNRITAVMYKKIFEDLKSEGIHKLNTKVIVSLSGKGDSLEKQCPDYLDLVTPSDKIKSVVKEFTLPFPQLEKAWLTIKQARLSTVMIIFSLSLTCC